MIPDLELVMDAVEIKKRGGLSYADCFVLAVSKKYKGVALVRDKEFEKFEVDFEIKQI